MHVTAQSIFDVRAGRLELDGTSILDDVDFRLRAGEFLALLGANGAGKTTLVRALLGLAPLTSGQITVFGVPLASFREWSRVGYVPQRLAAASGAPASVMEVVLSGRVGRAPRLRPYRTVDRAIAAEALDALDLAGSASTPVAHLSSGQQQRVLVARALAAEPDVLVLDEPVSGVDLDHQQRLARTLAEFVARGGSVLLVAHSLGPMEELVSREVVLEAGRVVYDGPHLPHHVHAEHVHDFDARVERSPLDRAVEGR